MKTKNTLIKIYILVLILLLLSCSINSNIPNKISESGENEKMNAIVNNADSYEKIVSKPYTKEDIQKVYIPYSSKVIMSTWLGVENVERFIDISFTRKVEQYYYTYYKTDAQRMFVFFSLDGTMGATLNLNRTLLNKADFEKLETGKSSIDDVRLIDASTLAPQYCPEILNDEAPSNDVISSEHILANGDIIIISYELKNGELIISSIDTTFTQTVEKYLSLIMDIDK